MSNDTPDYTNQISDEDFNDAAYSDRPRGPLKASDVFGDEPEGDEVDIEDEEFGEMVDHYYSEDGSGEDDDETVELEVTPSTGYIASAAYMIGKGDATALPPVDMLARCIRLLQSETKEEAQFVIDSPDLPTLK